MNISPELEKQISDEAEAYAQITFDETWHKKGLHRKTLLRYAHQDGAKGYALKWEQAEAMIEKMAKALERVLNQEPAKGREGCAWGDTEYDSMSAAVGYNEVLANIKPITNDALTDYNTYKKSKDDK